MSDKSSARRKSGLVVPAHLIEHEKPVEEPADDFPRARSIMLHQHVHARTGIFGFPGVTMQVGLEGIDKANGGATVFVCEGSIRDMLHMAQLIRKTGLQVPNNHW